jgi:DNA/RNA endonuclease YhcR with UshA esterase domain
VKAHVGMQGSELAGSLAKKAAMEDKGEIVYKKKPRGSITTKQVQSGITRWQEQWTSSKKGAVSKLFFPHLKERLKITLPLSAEFTAVVTGHGLTRSYLNRLKIIPNSTCSCRLKEEQTINHIIFNCTPLEHQRSTLHKATVQLATPDPHHLNTSPANTSRS